MKTKIVYTLVATTEETFFEEMWASIYSLRLYEPDRDVVVCCDELTANYIRSYPKLVNMITEVVVVPVKEDYNKMQRSREIKTNLRELVKGNFLYVDGDTIFTGTLEGIDTLTCDVAAVPEFNVPLSKYYYRQACISRVKDSFDVDISDAERQHNGGVIYAADTPVAHELYRRWHENWRYASEEKGRSADQPPLMKADKEMGYIVKELSGEYNCQLAMCVEHLFKAKIIHFIHFSILPVPNHPFLNRSIYYKIKEAKEITPEVSDLIRNCKSAFVTPSAIVDGDTVEFLLSNPGCVFMRITREGGILLAIMNKFAGLVGRWYNFIDKHKK